MKKTLFGLSAIFFAMFFITSCKKESTLKELTNNPTPKDTTVTTPKDTTVTTPKDSTISVGDTTTVPTTDTSNTTTPTVEVKPLNLYMTDYYPDSFYHDYATLKVVNDHNNLYITLTSLNDFKLKKVKLLVGSLDHLQTILMPYTHPAVSEIGPDPSDYIQNFTDLSSDTYTIIIPKSSLKDSNVSIYAWASVEKYDTDGKVTDWRNIWPHTTQNINGDAATSYFQYTWQ